MKKIFAIIMALSLLLTTLMGCSSSSSTSTESQSESAEKTSFHVVTTNFALYDWAKTIIGADESVTLTYLLDTGIDSHSYQPSADDIIEIASSDMFIYVGGESDAWVDGVLAQSINEDMVVLNLMEVLGDGALAEETVEGMEVTEHDHDHEDEETEVDHDHDHEDEEDHAHEDEDDHAHEDEEEHDHDDEEDHAHEDEEDHAHDDEHIWLSLRNAQLLVTAIADELSAMNSANADVYAENLAAYITALDELDAQYIEAVANANGNTILVADRFPLLYLVNDYGIEYYAAFNGCSAETEASFETIIFLAGKVDELALGTILTIENVQHQIAETVSASTATQDQNILIIDSMQSTTAEAIEAGATYYNIMEENLVVLIEALG